MTEREVRVRFAPSPSGDLHVGNVRTALFDWAYARHTGGTFVLRIEDTDQSRVLPQYVASAQESLHWLGLDWDEGPGVGGEAGPYLQSERRGIYATWLAQFLDSGHAYRCYCTQPEVQERTAAARAAGRPSGYDGHCRDLEPAQVSAYEAEGRTPVVRMRMPEGTTVFTDLVRGQITIDHASVPDFVLARADGSPLYTLAVAVDDVLMHITHIVRGDDLLSSTPRQLAVYRAMGVADADFPVFAHLPYVLGNAGEPLSKRYGSASISWYREQGFLPEAVVNYLALLGWSRADGRELFTLSELAAEFELSRVGKNAARFDMNKLESINGDKIRALEPADFAARIIPFLHASELVADPPTAQQLSIVQAAAPLIQGRIARLAEAPSMIGFLLADDSSFMVDPGDAAKSLGPDAAAVLHAAHTALAATQPWTAEPIRAALQAALVDGMGLKPRVAFSGPVRVAVTGRRIGPPLFESLELLGRDTTLARLAAAAS